MIKKEPLRYLLKQTFLNPNRGNRGVEFLWSYARKQVEDYKNVQTDEEARAEKISNYREAIDWTKKNDYGRSQVDIEKSVGFFEREIQILENPELLKSKIEESERELEIRQKEYNKFSREEEEAKRLADEREPILNYFVALAGRKKGIRVPAEDLVYDTLRRLSGHTLEGSLGSDGQIMELTMQLESLVRDVSYLHALRIDQDPEKYFSKIKANERPDVLEI